MSSNEMDFGGLTLVVDGVRVGATKPGQAGTLLSGSEITLLDGLTGGTVTASKAVVVDANKDIFSFRNVGITGTQTVTAGGQIKSSVANTVYPVTLNQVQQAVSTATAVTLTQYFTTIDSTSGALALTLADSTVTGQVKKVQMIVDNGDATLTFNTNATIVFEDVGDTAELIWNGSDWIPIALYNIVDGATAPAYTPAS